MDFVPPELSFAAELTLALFKLRAAHELFCLGCPDPLPHCERTDKAYAVIADELRKLETEYSLLDHHVQEAAVVAVNDLIDKKISANKSACINSLILVKMHAMLDKLRLAFVVLADKVVEGARAELESLVQSSRDDLLRLIQQIRWNGQLMITHNLPAGFWPFFMLSSIVAVLLGALVMSIVYLGGSHTQTKVLSFVNIFAAAVMRMVTRRRRR